MESGWQEIPKSGRLSRTGRPHFKRLILQSVGRTAMKQDSDRVGKRIYVREGEESVGPFRAREDALRFIALIECFGVGSEGIEVIEVNGDELPAPMSRRDDVKRVFA
jgi:hypothetical protein